VAVVQVTDVIAAMIATNTTNEQGEGISVATRIPAMKKMAVDIADWTIAYFVLEMVIIHYSKNIFYSAFSAILIERVKLA
jgi:hypothetical protein